MNNTTITLRTTEEFKDELELKAFTNDTSVSKIIRKLADNFIEQDQTLENYISNMQNHHIDDGFGLIQSLGFTELIFWVFDKKRDPEACEIEELYIQFVDLIEEMKTDILFSNEILFEFNKVSKELMEYLNGDYKDYFDFPNGENGFDYKVLSDFMHTLRYDETKVKQVIFIK